MDLYCFFWQALDIVKSSRKGYCGNLTSQSPEMPTTNSALLPGQGALLDFLKHELVLQLPWSCLVALFVDMICGEFRSSVSFFSGEAENSSSPEVQKKISFTVKSPSKLKGEMARLAGFNPSPESAVGKRPGGGGKK